MALDSFEKFYLMGVKGVAMTSIAQILLDAGKRVSGCDVFGDFVTKKILDRLQLKIDLGFVHTLPEDIDCVIFTSAHGGPINPIVLQAKERNITCFSQAEALAYFFNQKVGIAVSGVGGKSTVSAMITWIMQKLDLQPSFSVGVGEILGMERTGRWNNSSQYFIAEADEYVIDPACSNEGIEMIPRFSFLKPKIIVCTNLVFDHPDVYHSIQHTKEVFLNFFSQIKEGGSLIYNADSADLIEVIQKVQNVQKKSFGALEQANARLISSVVKNQKNIGVVQIKDKQLTVELAIPGKFNLMNALASCLAVEAVGVKIEDAINALADFKGTQRRFEFVGVKGGIYYYDDYAHHPHEIKQTINALKEWYPNQRRVVAFQPHTFSRTKQLFSEFVDTLANADELILLDIFPSARENFDSSVSSKMLADTISKQNNKIKILHLQNVEELADYCAKQLNAGDVFLTMGAGDIYEVHEEIGS